MQRLVFWLTYPLLWLISKLPFPVFYKVSDRIFFLIFYIFRYRRKIVSENLILVFPEKPSEEIRSMDKSIILACGHYASFEWMNALQLYGYDYRGFGVYKKIKNKYFDKMARGI